MIVLDTHIWVWWVHGDERLTEAQVEAITANENRLLAGLVTGLFMFGLAEVAGADAISYSNAVIALKLAILCTMDLTSFFN